MSREIRRCIVTGAAGFVGSTLCDRLLRDNIEVLGIDNLSTGKREFLAPALQYRGFRFVELDLLRREETAALFRDAAADAVIHLASHADVRYGLRHPSVDLEQGVLVTHSVLEATRLAKIPRFAFSSTGSVYGEPSVFPTPETCPFPTQTSLYAAAKLSAESFIQAYGTGYGIQVYIFRFVSLLGERYTHGHVVDFVRKLRHDPSRIEVLGDGKQTKSYLYVGDCVEAVLHLLRVSHEPIGVFNLGTNEHVTVDGSLDLICARMGHSPMRQYTGGTRGWVGDSPFIFLDCSRARSLGWTPTRTIEESVGRTVDFLLANPHLITELGPAC